MEALNKAGLVQFTSMITDKGWINPNTGNAWKAAIGKILGDVAPDADVRTIDVDTAVRYFNNRNPGVLTPESLQTYAKRVKNAIANYVSYVDDPVKYRAPARTPSANGTRKLAAQSAPKSDSTTEAVIEQPPPAAHTPARTEPVSLATEANLALPFPLRPGYLAQVVIPRDMTKAEASRLCAFIQTLALAE
jgi:hypothetical protein